MIAVGKWTRAISALAILALAGCAGSGGGSPAANRQAACEGMCNHNYDSCSDSLGARSGGGAFGVGIGAACERENRSCLEQCRMIAAEPDPVTGDTSTSGERKAP